MSSDIASMASAEQSNSSNKLVWTIVAGLIVYVGSALFGLPQLATEMVVAGHTAHATTDDHTHEHSASSHATDGHAAEEAHSTSTAPPYWTVIPFVCLLGAIALFPLIRKTEHWWEQNINRFKVAAILGCVTICYYAFLHNAPVEGHWPAHSVAVATDSAVQTGFVGAILGNALLAEFVPFIVLLFSLYTIAGGVRIEGDLHANPLTNASFMAVGGLLASFIGTTGAAMLLIRPLLDTNDERKHVAHTIVFFIFIVCNCGGCLLPIGDPPLFLGYLEGVSFSWTLGLWREWMFVNGLLLLTYCMLDQFYFYRRESIRDIKRDITHTRKLRISGLALNGPLLLGVVLSVALLDPNKAVPGTHWHSWMFLREAVQLALVAASLYFGCKMVREKNTFNYHAIVEVACLFVGIFICMQPALQILAEHGDAIAGMLSPAGFFWATGGLSSFLDNAPTYLVFFKSAQDPAVAATATAGVEEMVLRGIAMGAVFMGAMTYIGNGPNFMVKAIAEKGGIKMPSFFGYMGYSCCILLPILALTHWTYLSDTDTAKPAEVSLTTEARVSPSEAPVAAYPTLAGSTTTAMAH